ncbi:MAG: sulfite exporter TauE/SafE family protein [Pseudomonadota bacterium]
MHYIIICATALLVAALTFFSGFGLGTLLMPVFAIFFPVELAVAATAAVHLANNIFKTALIGKKANLGVVAKFALPAAAFAVLGALLLGYMSGIKPIYEYQLGIRTCSITVVKLVISLLIFIFALFELTPKLKDFSLNPKYIPIGGILSGFFGGLSGHQGALRTMFLIRLGLTKEAFIGTVVLSAVIVDIFRIAVYGVTFVSKDLTLLAMKNSVGLIVAGTIAAFIGSFIGSRLLKKVTMHSMQIIIGVMLFVLAFALGLGII